VHERSASAADALDPLPRSIGRPADRAHLDRLFASGADPNAGSLAPEPYSGYDDAIAGTTPLAVVARDRQIAAAATLCALGADPDVRDSTGASARQVAVRTAAKQAAQRNPTHVDVVRHQNMAAFLAAGGGCDGLFARRRRGETIAEAEVLRIAYESECGAGWGWACGQAGWAFGNGEGAPRDAARAIALFRKGCEDVLSTSAWCCGMVGIYHVEGSAVPKDPVAGARWLSRGCEPPLPRQADAQSCGRLGLLYAEGSGVGKDPGRARVLFRKACDGKYESGCENFTKYATAN
jgi:TPR repeat protein